MKGIRALTIAVVLTISHVFLGGLVGADKAVQAKADQVIFTTEFWPPWVFKMADEMYGALIQVMGIRGGDEVGKVEETLMEKNIYVVVFKKTKTLAKVINQQGIDISDEALDAFLAQFNDKGRIWSIATATDGTKILGINGDEISRFEYINILKKSKILG